MLFVILLAALAAGPDAGVDAGSMPHQNLPADGGFYADADARGQEIDAAKADAGSTPYQSLAADGGFSVDAGERGQVIDATKGNAAPRTAEAVVPRVTVTIRGALVLPPEVYLDTLRLPHYDHPDQATAREVRRQLEDFLKRTGFELATVTTRVTPDGIEAEIDEGKIDRIIFLGRLSFQQVRFKLGLVLPYGVFNRAMLDRQVRELGEKLKMPGVRWELVRTAAVEHEGPQITRLPKVMDLQVAGKQLVHERRPYEVRISFPQANASFLGIDLRINYLYGFESGVNYTGRDLVGKGDLWYLATSGGFGLRSRIGTEKLYPYFSRALVEGRYYTVPLLKYLRPNLWTEGSLISRQRADLNLEKYWALTADAALQVEAELRPGLRFLAGGGFEYRRLFGLEVAPGTGAPADVAVAERRRPFLRATHESVIDPFVLRWDRRHTLESELRYYFPFNSELGFGWAELDYQYVKELGWHDFWIKTRGHVTWGEVTFHDEISLGELLRGLFGDQWVPSGANLQLEFRFSLVRDDIKIGVFHDLALFAVPLRTQDGQLVVELGNGFGPSVHFLPWDMFQLDMYTAFGFRPNDHFNVAFSMQLQKAF